MHNHEQVKRIVVLDFETFYSTEYSLSRLPMQDYIMDDQFQTIGLGTYDSTQPDLPSWRTGHEAVAGYLEHARLDEPGTLTIAHNAQFDGGILEWRYGVKPWMYLCTMMGARPHLIQHTKAGKMSLGELAPQVCMEKGMEVINARGKRLEDFSDTELISYGGYCVNDVCIAKLLGEIILSQLPWEELRLIDQTVKQFTRPQLRIDWRKLVEHIKSIRRRKAELLERCGLTDPTELRSNERFAELLRAHGMTELPLKISTVTGKETFAFAKTDAAFKSMVLEHPDPDIVALGEARVGHKTSLAESRAVRLLRLSRHGKVGVPTLYYGAHTGRQSGYDKLNFLNMPRGSMLRESVRAPAGHCIVAGDLAQIEARVLAALARCESLLALFRSGQDPYRLFASEQVYNVPLDAVTDEMRRICKSAILGLGFGMGWDAFETYLGVMGVTGLSQPQIKHIVYDIYRKSFPEVPELWDVAGDRWMSVLQGLTAAERHEPLLIARGFIGLPNGMPIHYTNLKNDFRLGFMYGPEGARKRIYGPKMIENVVQALARIILTRAQLFLADRGIRAAFTVYDELIYVVPERHAEKLAHVLHRTLTRTVPWLPDLPIEAEVKIGPNYGDLTVWKEAA